MSFLAETDGEIFAAIQKETERLEGNLELIASENVVSEAVLEAQGCVMTNKYAEGYPGAAVSSLTKSSPWLLRAQSNYSAPIMLTSNRIRVPRPT